MQLEKVKEIKKFASEVILKVLMKMSKDYEHYEKLEDFDGMQRVKLEFIPKDTSISQNIECSSAPLEWNGTDSQTIIIPPGNSTT